MRYLQTIFGTRPVPQTEPLPDRTGQRVNSAGGYVWPVDNWTRLQRFLILGSEGGTYYIEERALTVENAQSVAACLRQDGERVVQTIREISTSGRAPKNTPALFALAMAASPRFATSSVNAAALDALPAVARTASHLSAFAEFVTGMRGWGRSLRRAIGDWYVDRPVPDLAYQLVKYQQRNGWSHRDLLRLSHPKAATASQQALFHWAVSGELDAAIAFESAYADLRQVEAYERVKRATTEDDVVELVHIYQLTHEMVPSRWKQSRKVWEALIEWMPYTALLRQLAKLTEIGVLTEQGEATAMAVSRLTDGQRLRKARVHPVALLSALMTYRRGQGVRGRLAWVPVAAVIDALDEAFHQSFTYVESSGRRMYLAIDASGSMQTSS